MVKEPMQNLEQIRAATALEPAKKLDKSAVSKLPALILTNGLLATAAFCQSESDAKNRGDMKEALELTAKHLENRELLGQGKGDLDGLIKDLSNKSSIQLQNATSEALAFIAYLKRFAKKEKSNN